jgi:hypothetical protein
VRQSIELGRRVASGGRREGKGGKEGGKEGREGGKRVKIRRGGGG